MTPDDEFRELRDFYDREYHAHASALGGIPWHSRAIARRLGELRGKHVLDVACGTGAWLEHLAGKGAFVAGIDISARAIEVCTHRLPAGRFAVGPAETLPFPDAHFDLVSCLGSLEHFGDKERALAEMCRVSRPDATLLILVPNAGFLTRRLGLYRGTQQARVRETVLELREWEALLERSGLRVVERWRDLHVLNRSWLAAGGLRGWPLRLAQAALLPLLPVAWQYQVYFVCRKRKPPGA